MFNNKHLLNEVSKLTDKSHISTFFLILNKLLQQIQQATNIALHLYL